MAYTGNVIGVQSTINQLDANKMPDNDRFLYLLEPYQAPVLQWLYFSKGQNEAEVVINPDGEFGWFEDEYFPYQTTLTGGAVAGGAPSEDNIGLTDKTWINEGDLLLIEKTEELVYVDSTASAEVDITSLDGGNITVASSGYVKKIGSVNHEYALPRVAVSTKEIKVTNYCTIFEETVTTTGRRQAGDTYTGKKSHKDEVRKKTFEMKQEFERNFLFSTEKGTRTVSTAEGDFRHTFGMGFLGRVTTNRTSYAGAAALTEAALDAYLEKVFTGKGSSKVKRHYCGATQLNSINKIVKDKYQTIPITKEYGVNLTTYVTPFGVLKLIWDPIFDGKFKSYGFTVDEKGMKLRYMANDDKGPRKFRVEEGVETPGRDGKSTKLLADLGIQIYGQERHGILYDSTV